jgi:DNA-binding response OmpR family regulator
VSRILVVDDDPTVAEVVMSYLKREGLDARHADDGLAALAVATDYQPDLVVLDLMLPGIDGLEVCRRLRAGGSEVPIVMLTARGEEEDRVLGLEVGADDYVTKPFSFRELLARIRAVVRRTHPETPAVPPEGAASVQVQRLGPLEIDRRTRRVHLDGEEVHLTAKEFDLLAYLAVDPGAVSTRLQILEHVWDAHWYGPTKTVDAHVAALRKKLGAHEWIAAVRGVGFRLEVPG